MSFWRYTRSDCWNDASIKHINAAKKFGWQIMQLPSFCWLYLLRKRGCQAMKQEASYIICNPPVGYVKWNPYHAGKQRDMCDECMLLRPCHLGDGTMRRAFARSLLARWKNRNTSKDLRHGVCTAEWKWLNCSCDGKGNLKYDPTQQWLRIMQLYKYFVLNLGPVLFKGSVLTAKQKSNKRMMYKQPWELRTKEHVRRQTCTGASKYCIAESRRYSSGQLPFKATSFRNVAQCSLIGKYKKR